LQSALRYRQRTVSGPGCMPQGSGLECFVPNLPS